nr:CD9 antigen-like [Paramormyrops kingsleyae]
MKTAGAHGSLLLPQFFFFLLVIFAAEVAAGIWGFSNQDKVVNEITEFYIQTLQKYRDSRADALKETLRLIQFGVSSCAAASLWLYVRWARLPPRQG